MNARTMPWVVVLTALVMPVAVTAQPGGDYDLSWSTIDGGGVMFATGGDFELAGTIGQPDAVPQAAPLIGGDYQLIGGFWVPFGPACFIYSILDFDADCDVDGDDLDAFVNCASGPAITQANPDCEWARLDGDDDVDQGDFGVFQRCYSGEGSPADPNCLN